MGKRCLNCGKEEENNSIRYCSKCGTEYPQNDLEVFLDIREFQIKADKETSRFNKVILTFTLGSLFFYVISLVLNERNFLLANPNVTANASFVTSDLAVMIVIGGYTVVICALVVWIYRSE